MATWTNIPDTVLEPGKPARSVDALALRDNPVAIAEGAAGAPRVVAAGLASNSVTTAKVVNRNITEAKLAVGTAERNWVLARTAEAGQGAVGTYAFVTRITRSNSTGRVVWGSNAAGSTLRAALVSNLSVVSDGTDLTPALSAVSLAGTWKIMGRVTGGRDSEEAFGTLALRVS